MWGKRGIRARRHRLFWRTAAAILALLTLAVTVPALLRLANETRTAREELTERAIASANVTASTVAALVALHDPQALVHLVTTVAALDPDVDAVLVSDRSGRILADSTREREGTVRPDLGAAPGEARVVEIVRANGGAALQVTTPVVVGNARWGTVQLEAGL